MIANPDETKNHYKAMKLLDDLAYSKEFLIEYKLNNGDKIHNFPTTICEILTSFKNIFRRVCMFR